MASNPELLASLDRKLSHGLVRLIQQHQGVVPTWIENTVAGWDAQGAADLVEVEFGRDLQFIRINGTLVGGLVGILLHLFALVLTR